MANPCVDLGYDVVSGSATVPSGSGTYEFRVAAPSGKKILGGGAKLYFTSGEWTVLHHHYPDESTNEWVFVFFKVGSTSTSADCYVTVINA